jgi:hypothetical protein
MKGEILWQPTVKEGEKLIGLADTERFIQEMQTAFPGEWPIQLVAKHIERLEGMAAATSIFGNPYLTLLTALKRYKAITVWPEWGDEGAI